MAETLRSWLEKPLSEVLNIDVNTLPARDAIAVAAIQKAATSDGERDRIHIFDRVDGRPKQTIEESRAEDDPYLEFQREIFRKLNLGANK